MATHAQARTATEERVLTAVQSDSRRDRFQTPDQLFVALDGRTITAAGQMWRLEVFGIRDRAGHRWIQLGVDSDQSAQQMATLRLVAGASVQHVLLALQSWLANPAADVSGVLNVA